MPQNLIVLDASQDALWDELVLSSPQGSEFMLSAWLPMLASTLNSPLQVERIGYLGKDRKLIAGWAIPYQELRLWKLRISNGGYGLRYSGPLLNQALSEDPRKTMVRNQVLSQFAAYAGARYDSIVVECHPAFTDPREFIYAGWSIAPVYQYRWNLSDPDALLASLDNEKRREIRRGLESFQFSRERIDKQSFEQFLTIYRSTMQHRHDIGLGEDWVKNLERRLLWMQDIDACGLFVAKNDASEYAAVLLAIISRADHTVYFWMAGYDQNLKGNKVLSSLYWFTGQEILGSTPGIKFADFSVAPSRSLSQYKDLLRADITLSFRMIHDKRSWKQNLRNGLRQARNLAGSLR